MTLRGRLQYGVPLAPMTWLRVGGPAEILFTPADEEDLAAFLTAYPGSVNLVLGAGSNLLVRDGGVPGATIKLGKGFYQFSVQGNEVEVGAGLLDRVVAERCLSAGISGLEFLYTIPGAIGGALRMNAGCYGGEIADRLKWAWAMDPQGCKHKLSGQDLAYQYRSCALPAGWIFLSACFQGVSADKAAIAQTMKDFAKMREESQPLRVRTGGSTFANPPGHKAWALIDQIGYRGKFKGQAQFSEKHCNFLLNCGDASSADLEGLGEEAREKVWQATGIRLKWEVVRVGKGLETNLDLEKGLETWGVTS